MEHAPPDAVTCCNVVSAATISLLLGLLDAYDHHYSISRLLESGKSEQEPDA
jgi:hypothetical protein